MTDKFKDFFNTVSPFKTYGQCDPAEKQASKLLRRINRLAPIIQFLTPHYHPRMTDQERARVIVLRCEFASWSKFYRDPRKNNYSPHLLLIHHDGRVEFNGNDAHLRRIAKLIQHGISH